MTLLAFHSIYLEVRMKLAMLLADFILRVRPRRNFPPLLIFLVVMSCVSQMTFSNSHLIGSCVCFRSPDSQKTS